MVRKTIVLGCVDKLNTLKWCTKRKLIRNNMVCTFCRRDMTLVSRLQLSDGYNWYCCSCNKRKSVRSNSWFAKSKLKIKQIIILTYCWAYNFTQKQTLREIGCKSTRIASDWFNFCRELCQAALQDNQHTIGGIDDNFNPKIVEIDESIFCKRKYNRGRLREHTWVFGAIERNK